ncbi:MAG: hypothetical protein EHM35_00940 [Planctomycetaceae bacterium]|nr:MAG: hypothetical protein EHM35_00940 [Planctomycetaceae bacterium]
MFGCFFGHDWRRLGHWMPVRYEWATGNSTGIKYPVQCQRCGKVDLKSRDGSYSVSYYSTYTQEEAMEKAHELAAEQQEEATDE